MLHSRKWCMHPRCNSCIVTRRVPSICTIHKKKFDGAFLDHAVRARRAHAQDRGVFANKEPKGVPHRVQIEPHLHLRLAEAENAPYWWCTIEVQSNCLPLDKEAGEFRKHGIFYELVAYLLNKCLFPFPKRGAIQAFH